MIFFPTENIPSIGLKIVKTGERLMSQHTKEHRETGVTVNLLVKN